MYTSWPTLIVIREPGTLLPGIRDYSGPYSQPAREHGYVFSIDGEDFPWLISEKGPVVTKLADDLWKIYIEILQLSEGLEFKIEDGCYGWPYIGGRRFPWPITSEGLVLEAGRGKLGMLKLAFYAKNVDTNGPITDASPRESKREQWGMSGDLFRKGKPAD